MTTASLEKVLNQAKSFTLFLTDGRKISIPHHEFVWLIPPHKSEMVISHGRRGGIEFLRVNQIVSIRWRDHQAA